MSQVVVFVNRDKFTLPSDEVKVGTLIADGGGEPVNQYELQQREGADGPVIKTYTNSDETIKVKDGEHFTTKYIGQPVVS
jgi:hypothetical protein